MKALTLEHVEARRAALGVTKQDLEREAGLPTGYYSGYLLAGRVRPRRSTLTKLWLASKNVAWRTRQNHAAVTAKALFRMAMVLVAAATGRKPADLHRHDPARRATQSAEWMAAAEVRQIALYLLHIGLGLSQTWIADGAGMTKQAVSNAVQNIEDRRSDPELDRLLDRLTADIQGEW
jgi:hypothetical protein